MKLAPTILAVQVVLASAAFAQQNLYGWTISNSVTDPYSNTGPIAPGPSMFAGNLYLWLACTSNDGATAAEFDVVETRGAGLPTGFTPATGVFPTFVPPSLLLVFSSCAYGPTLVGSFSVAPDAFTPDIELCIVPTPAGVNTTTDCAPDPQAWPNASIGFAKTSPAACVETLCQPTVSVSEDGSSWGSVKALYR